MAKNEDLRVQVTANDQASAKLDKVADKVAEIEGTHEAEIVAEDRASDEINDVAAKLARLSDDDKVIVLRGQAQQLEREIQRAERSLANIERFDNTEIDLRIEARNNARQKLEQVEAQMRELDGKTADVNVEADGLAATNGQLDAMLSKLDALPGNLGAVSGSLKGIAGPAGLVAALGTGLFAAAEHASNVALEVGELKNLTGDSAEEASRIRSVWQSAGYDVKDLQDVILQMNGVLNDSPEIAARLGIELDDGKSSGERFVQVAQALNTQVGDAFERGILGGKLFGEEGVRQVNGVITRVGDLSQAIEDVPENQLITDADIERARQYTAELNRVKTEITGIVLSVAQDAIPVLSGLGAVLSGDAFSTDFWSEPAAGMEGLTEKAQRYMQQLSLTEEQVVEMIGAEAAYVDGVGRSTEATDAATEGARAFADLLANRLNPDIVGVTISAEEQARVTRENEAAQREAKAAADEYSAAIARQRSETYALKDSFSALKGELAMENTFLSIQDGFARTQTAAEQAYIAAAEGADDAEGKARDHQRAVNDTKLAVLEYIGQLGNVPDEVVSQIIADIDEGSLASAEERLAVLTRNRTMSIDIQTRGGIGYGPGPYRHTGGRTEPGPTYTVGRPGAEELWTPDGPMSGGFGTMRAQESWPRPEPSPSGPLVYVAHATFNNGLEVDGFARALNLHMMAGS